MIRRSLAATGLTAQEPVPAPRRATAPKPGAGSRLNRFLVLERGFESTVGLRLATDLHNLGGTPGCAKRTPPVPRDYRAGVCSISKHAGELARAATLAG